MAANESMKSNERILHDEAFRCRVPVDPMCRDTEIGSAVVVGPCICCERNFANRTLIVFYVR
jgi:hypothetical protein